MPDAEIQNWLMEQDSANLSKLLRTVTRSNLHPYGFTVHRLSFPELAPWEIRLHIWPQSIDSYSHMSKWATENLSIHAHGWSLFSRVLIGSLEEYTYKHVGDANGPFTVYSTRGAVRQSASRLKPAGKAEFGLLDFKVRRPENGVYAIPEGAFHSTLPGELSVSLVATNQKPRQISEVAGFRESREDISNSSPEINSVDIPDLHLGQAAWSSSFVFFSRPGEVLLARTRVRPDQWQPIGGHREDGDSSPLATLVRETREETNLTLLQPTLNWLGFQPSDGLDEGIACFWEAPEGGHNQRRIERVSDELLQLRWWKLDDAIDLPMYEGSSVVLKQMLQNSSRAGGGSGE